MSRQEPSPDGAPEAFERPEGPPFDVDVFLAQPLVARVALAGPSVRPVWYLWEDGCFWWITGAHSGVADVLARDPRVALVVDSCDILTGCVRQVTGRGLAVVEPLDAGRAVRKLTRYLGADQSRWDGRFIEALYEDESTRLIRVRPSMLRAHDYSFQPSLTATSPGLA
jgi:hypothetical protein